MQMHDLERWIVNSPLTTLAHRCAALPRVLGMANGPIRGPLLEVGCGKGTTTSGLLARVPGIQVTAIDYDARQVAKAKARLAGRAVVEQGDVTALGFAAGAFGTAVELNTLHHVADWRRALAEIFRVLRPGGKFLFMDYTAGFFRGPLGRMFPPESRFTPAEFEAALRTVGFEACRMRGRLVIRGACTKPPI